MPSMYQPLIRGGRVIVKIFTVVALLVSLGCSSSSSPTSNGGSPQFTPTAAQVNVGDTVTWTATAGNHTITSGTGSSDPSAGSLFDQQLAQSQSFSHVFATAGVVHYFCRTHEAMGMKGTVTVLQPVPKTVQVSAGGASLSFSPANMTINVGDTVKWTVSGTHTITSGTDPTDPNVGALFDQQHMTTGQTFSFVFTTPGTVHYFCRFHEAMGMKGTITVTSPEPKTVHVSAST